MTEQERLDAVANEYTTIMNMLLQRCLQLSISLSAANARIAQLEKPVEMGEPK